MVSLISFVEHQPTNRENKDLDINRPTMTRWLFVLVHLCAYLVMIQSFCISTYKRCSYDVAVAFSSRKRPRALIGSYDFLIKNSRRLSTTVNQAPDSVVLQQQAESGTDDSIHDRKVSLQSTSDWVTHVLVTNDENNDNNSTDNHRYWKTLPVPVTDIVQNVLDYRRRNYKSSDTTTLNATELLNLGAIWYLPHYMPSDPALGGKPRRLMFLPHQDPIPSDCMPTTNKSRIPANIDYSKLKLVDGDYLRIHHDPRRFPAVHKYDWSAKYDASDSGNNTGVIVAQDEELGYMVINKPATVPVHMTVDNAQENVAACLYEAGHGPYVSTPQRLDQNTSGLLVVATSKQFAAYFATLLSNKTINHLDETSNGSSSSRRESINKLYRCLVCLGSSPYVEIHDGSVESCLNWLQTMAQEQYQLRHYLEPSIRAPKRFVSLAPPLQEKTWSECLLKIHRVGSVVGYLFSNESNNDKNSPESVLAHSLWLDDTGLSARRPRHVQAVAELEIELLTGRTHQIRGQLAAVGMPLVGDALYGGAEPMLPTGELYHYGSERLALQCCELEFLDPKTRTNTKGITKFVPSDRWNKFRIEEAWWTPLLNEYRDAMLRDSKDKLCEVTMSGDHDTNLPAKETSIELGKPKWYKATSESVKPNLLPPRVSLSPGKNKYVLIKAVPSNTETTKDIIDQVIWFVKSASGAYHGNVAQDLREWINAAGYDVCVTGGGRIDYNDTAQRAIVYGFSYGFGRANHRQTAAIIRRELGDKVEVVIDDSDEAY